jgi:hypothetical protein
MLKVAAVLEFRWAGSGAGDGGEETTLQAVAAKMARTAGVNLANRMVPPRDLGGLGVPKQGTCPDGGSLATPWIPWSIFRQNKHLIVETR